jgi:peptide/nickel transport system substrate-binding protein
MTRDQLLCHPEIGCGPLKGLSRRQMLGALALGGAALTVGPLRAEEQPRRGGLLRVATYTQSTNDTCDPAKFVLAGDYIRARCFYNTLTWLDSSSEATPELAESYEAIDPSQTVWRFKLRRGVTFHDGAPLTPEDVRFSLLRHKVVASAARQLAANIKDVEVEGPDAIIIRLETPDVDLPLVVGTFHFSVVRDGTTDFAQPNGTGPFRIREFRPGLRTSGTRFENYWREGLPYVDAFELITILDTEARVNALLAGDVHLVNELRGPSIEQVANSSSARLLVTPTRRITSLQYRIDMAPSGNQELRLAMAHLIDRERYMETVLKGQGVLANDHPFMPGMPFYNASLPQRKLDRDKAKFHFARSGIGSSRIEVNVSDASPFSTDIAQLIQRDAARIGMNIDIRRNPSDSYWNNVSGQRPITANTINPRPTIAMNLNLSWRTGAPWNRTNLRNQELDRLIDQASAEPDLNRRSEIYGRVQQIIYDVAVMTIPAFMNYVDGMSNKVQGLKPLPVGLLGGYDFANTAWLSS